MAADHSVFDNKLSSVRKLEKEDRKFSEVMHSFRDCIRRKDYNCLIKKNSGFEKGIAQWSVLKNEVLCKDYRASYKTDIDDEILKKVKNKVVNWELYQKVFSLTDSKTTVSLETDNNAISLMLVLKGEEACTRESSILLNFTRSAGEWTVYVNSEASDS